MAHNFTSAGHHVDALEIIAKELVGLLNESQRSTVLENLSKEINEAETEQRKDIMSGYKSIVESSETL